MFVMFWTFLQHGGGYGLGTRSPRVLERRQNKGQCKKGGGPEDTRCRLSSPAEVLPGRRLLWLPESDGDDQPRCPLLGLQGMAPLPVTLDNAVPSLASFLPWGVTGWRLDGVHPPLGAASSHRIFREPHRKEEVEGP